MDILPASLGQLENRRSLLLETPGWFIVLVAVAYATGFLIVSTYLGSFGVQDPTSDLLRPRYLQVGFFFLLLFGSVVVLVVTMIGAFRTPGGLRVNWLLIPIWVDMIVFVYIAVGFAEPQSSGRNSLFVAFLVGASFLGVICIYNLERIYGARNPDLPKFAQVCYCLLLGGLFVLDWLVIRPFESKLWHLVRFGYLILAILGVLVACLGWLLYRAVFPREGLSKEQHRIFTWSRLAIGLPIYYVCVLAFAFGVYPFMSSSRGGGYYQDSDRITLVIRGGYSALPSNLVAVSTPSQMESKPLVLIEQTSSSLFVADPGDPQRPDQTGGVECWTDFTCRPRVLEVNLSDVVQVQHIPVGP
jgi:hypothetical protein